jgi:hypothetical protein
MPPRTFVSLLKEKEEEQEQEKEAASKTLQSEK